MQRLAVLPRSSGLSFSVLLALGLVCAAVSLRAQGGVRGVTGVVVDPLGARVPGARVTLLRAGRPVTETVTDAQGAFHFHKATEGRYQLLVEAKGFAPEMSDPLFVGQDASPVVNVTLQPAGLQEQVVVTAQATAAPASQVGASVTVLDRGTLQSLAKPDVLEALRLVPGLNVDQTGARGGITSIFVRGGESDFNKILIDGVPVNDIGGAFDFAQTATTGIDKVEVLRDPNSVLYGSDALTGVISLVTERGKTRVPELTIEADGGNLDTLRQDASLGGAVGRLDYFSALSHFSTDNKVLNNADHNLTFAGRYGLAIGSRSNLSVTVRRTGTQYGSPNGFDLYHLADDSVLRTDTSELGAALQSTIGRRWQSELRFASMSEGYHSDNPSPTGEPFDPFGSGAPNYLGHVVTLVGANGYSVTGQAILDYSGAYPDLYDASTTRRSAYAQLTGHLSDWLDLSAGTRLEHEDGSTTYQSVRSATMRTNAGLFGEARVRLHRLFVSGGLAYDHNAVFQSAVTPRVSAALYLRDAESAPRLGDTKVTFNAGTGIKAPNISQELSSLYSLVQSLPVEERPAGPTLTPIGPERSRSIDVGVQQGFWHDRARASLTYFHNQFSDLIEFVSAGVLPRLGVPAAVADATGYGAYVNSSSYWAHGLEFSAEAALGPHVELRGSYTHLRAVVTQSFASSALAPAYNPAFPDIPIGVYGPLVGAAPFHRPANVGNVLLVISKHPLQIALAGDFVGKSDDSTFLSDGYFGNTMLLPNHDLDPAYQKVDLSGSYTVDPRVRVYVSIENLLDRRYQAAFGFPALPLTVRAGLQVTLGGDRRP